MFDNDKTINSPTTIMIYPYTGKRICTSIHKINSYICTHKFITSGSIGLFSNKWVNGTKYFGLHRMSVGNILIVELDRSEFLKRI